MLTEGVEILMDGFIPGMLSQKQVLTGSKILTKEETGVSRYSKSEVSLNYTTTGDGNSPGL
jgi:hypothetical protein